MADIAVIDQVRAATDPNAVGTGMRILRPMVEVDTDTYAPGMAVVGVDTTITLTGDLVVNTLGDLDDAKVVDPDAASATIPALLRGALVQHLATVTAVEAAASVLGAVDDAAEDNPDAASATVPSLLRGVLSQQAAILALIGATADAAGDPTVIGLLKQIAENTTPVP